GALPGCATPRCSRKVYHFSVQPRMTTWARQQGLTATEGQRNKDSYQLRVLRKLSAWRQRRDACIGSDSPASTLLGPIRSAIFESHDHGGETICPLSPVDRPAPSPIPRPRNDSRGLWWPYAKPTRPGPQSRDCSTVCARPSARATAPRKSTSRG